jgi:hypothetical protein
VAGNDPRSYRRLNSNGTKSVDPTAILVVHELDAILRARCPMQKKWISVRGKRTSCTWCPHLHKIRYTDWGGKIECKYEEGQPVYDFPMRGNTTDEPEECTE